MVRHLGAVGPDHPCGGDGRLARIVAKLDWLLRPGDAEEFRQLKGGQNRRCGQSNVALADFVVSATLVAVIVTVCWAAKRAAQCKLPPRTQCPRRD